MSALIDLKTGRQVGTTSENGVLSANAGYQLDLSLTTCHGISLKLGGETAAGAGISAEIAEYIELLIQAEAGAKVQLEATAVLSPEIDKDFGLTLSAQAVLQAYVKFRVEMGLKIGKLTSQLTQEYVNGTLPELPYRLFTAYLEDVSLAAVVEGKAEVAVAAQGIVSCRGRLIGKDPGFDVSVSGEAAFIFGMGMDFAVKGRFPKLVDYCEKAANIIIDECIELVTANQDDPTKRALVSIGLRAAFMGMLIPLSRVNDRKRKGIMDGVGEEVKAFILAELKKEAILLLKRTLNPEPPAGSSTAQKDKWNEAGELITAIDKAEDEVTTFTAVWEAVDVLEALDQKDHDDERHLVCLIYMMQYLTHDADTNGTSSLETLPGWLQSWFQVTTGTRATTKLTRKKAALYIEKSPAMQQVVDAGKLTKSLDRYAKTKQTTLSAIIIDLIDAKAKKREELLKQHLFGLAGMLIQEEVLPVVQQDLKVAMSVNKLSKEYYTEVIEPALLEFPHFLPLLQDFLNLAPNKKDLATLEYLSQRFFLRIIGRSTGLMLRYLLNNVVEHTDQALADFRIRASQPDIKQVVYSYTDKIDGVLENMYGPLALLITEDMKRNVAKATQEMLVETSGAARQAIGRPTWTEARIHNLTTHLGDLLASPDGKELILANRTIEDIRKQIEAIRDCSFLPATSHLEGLADQTLSLALAQFKVMLIDMPAIILRFGLKLAKILLLDPLINLVKAAYETIRDLANAAKERIASLLDDIRNAIEEMDRLVASAAQYVTQLAEDVVAYIDDFCDQLINWIDIGLWDAATDVALEIITLGNYTDSKTKALNLIAAQRRSMKTKARQYVTSLADSPENLSTANSAWVLEELVSNQLFSNVKKLQDEISFNGSKTAYLAYGNKVSDQLSVNTNVTEITNRSTSVILERNKIPLLEDALEFQRAKRDRLDAELADLRPGQRPEIEILAPHKVELVPGSGEGQFEREKLPIYGKFLYLQIKLTNVNIHQVISDQLNDQQFFSLEVPYRIKVMLNGQEISLTSFRVHDHQYLEGYVDKSMLRQGQNHLFALIAGVSVSQSSMDYTPFFCDLRKPPHFSNDLHIDTAGSQINAPGNDHSASTVREPDLEDREYLIIATRSQQSYDLNGYRIEDLADHQHTFGPTKLVPGKPVTLVTGKYTGTGGNVQSWLPPKGAHNKAILNNDGEAVLLRDPEGKVVDQAYFGNANNRSRFRARKLKASSE